MVGGCGLKGDLAEHLEGLVKGAGGLGEAHPQLGVVLGAALLLDEVLEQLGADRPATVMPFRA